MFSFYVPFAVLVYFLAFWCEKNVLFHCFSRRRQYLRCDISLFVVTEQKQEAFECEADQFYCTSIHKTKKCHTVASPSHSLFVSYHLLVFISEIHLFALVFIFIFLLLLFRKCLYLLLCKMKAHARTYSHPEQIRVFYFQNSRNSYITLWTWKMFLSLVFFFSFHSYALHHKSMENIFSFAAEFLSLWKGNYRVMSWHGMENMVKFPILLQTKW